MNTEGKLVSLEYIRGAAALCVAISHFLMRTYGSPIFEMSATLAVEVFFPLSGFVLSGQINYLIRERRGYGIFLTRRWMRTLPPYFIGLIAITLLLDEPLGSNFWLYIFSLKYSLPSFSSGDYYPIAWSLAVEEWYYLIFPGFLLVTISLMGKSVRPLPISLVFAAIILIAKLLTTEIIDPTFVRIASFFRLDAICLGFIFFLLFADRKTYIGEISTLIGSFLAICLLIFLNQDIDNGFNSILLFPILLPFFFAAFITLVAKLESHRRLTFNGRWKVIGLWFGRVSYSIYLFHIIIIYALFPNPHPSQLVYYLLCLIIFCVLFYRFFEKPIMEARPTYKETSSLR